MLHVETTCNVIKVITAIQQLMLTDVRPNSYGDKIHLYANILRALIVASLGDSRRSRDCVRLVSSGVARSKAFSSPDDWKLH